MDMSEYVYFSFFLFLRKLLILTKNFIYVLSHIFHEEFTPKFIPKYLLTPCTLFMIFDEVTNIR
jgi:hypothetical protein